MNEPVWSWLIGEFSGVGVDSGGSLARTSSLTGETLASLV